MSIDKSSTTKSLNFNLISVQQYQQQLLSLLQRLNKLNKKTSVSDKEREGVSGRERERDKKSC